jgi:gamma-glutamylcyclotransferase (GGCT)/AIG2-like uncharacterized protein YtfP
MKVLILLLAISVKTTYVYSQEYYIEDCNGHLYKPHNQEEYPKNVKWVVYWYRTSNGERWGESPDYKSAEKAFEALRKDMKMCGDCWLCDREYWCNGKVVAKVDCWGNSQGGNSNNNPIFSASKQQFLNYLKQLLKSFKEYIRPSYGGSIRNAGDVANEYYRVLNEARNQLNELIKKFKLTEDAINELTNELSSFETDLYLIQNDYSGQQINSGFNKSQDLVDDTMRAFDKKSDIPPLILQVDPWYVRRGEIIRIYGGNFGDYDKRDKIKVLINGHELQEIQEIYILDKTIHYISVEIPTDLKIGKATVQVYNGTISNEYEIEITP